MLKYAIVLLDKMSTAFCHADNPYRQSQLISLETLENVIFWCMKENLRIQFVYPDYALPKEHLKLIDTIDHVDIKHGGDTDISIYNGWRELNVNNLNSSAVVIRISKKELLDGYDVLKSLLHCRSHVSIVVRDVESFTAEDLKAYETLLHSLACEIEQIVLVKGLPQINILTDRLLVEGMNNCNAGVESITISPEGNFYICPAFYYCDENDTVGNIMTGLRVLNSHLYSISYAPICRNCDAFQCRRCVWLNRKMTNEVNTPSHEQCVMAHIERDSSRVLLNSIRKHGVFLPDLRIKELNYTDPFEKIVY